MFTSRALATRQLLMASAGTDVGKLGGAICARLRQEGQAEVQAMGPAALQRALRGLLRCRYWLQQERPGHETYLSVEAIHHEAGSKAEQAMGELRLAVLLRPRVVSAASEEDVVVSQKSNIGKLGAYVSSRLAEDAEVRLAVRSVGPKAGSQALRALSIATRLVAKDGYRLLLAPREEEKAEDAGPSVRQLVLVCHRMPLEE
ncbi:unnamed protein product [Durusdinium trenchii]|uniref:Uncharacterized protein n=1 Tax=Durusdinium trenchii TaxID=1381693 RepID=A0ABP0RJR8_9DINO